MNDILTISNQDVLSEIYEEYLQEAYGFTRKQMEEYRRYQYAKEKLFAVHKIFGDSWTMSEHCLRRSWIEKEIPTGEVGYTRGGKKWRFTSATRAKRYSS